MAEINFLQKPDNKTEKKDDPEGKAPAWTGLSYGAPIQRSVGVSDPLVAWRAVTNRVSPELTPESVRLHYVTKPESEWGGAPWQAHRLQQAVTAPVQRIKEGATAETLPARKTEQATNRTGIPDGMKSQFEAMSGLSFDDVRIHYSSGKPAQLQALAYTQGNQVYVGPGQEKHLPHELGHVVQQKEGRVKPTALLDKIEINDNTELEREASGLGEQALRFSGGLMAQPKCFLEKDGRKVIQMEPHADFNARVTVDPTVAPDVGLVAPDRPPPVMVYETFGNKAEQLVNVYRQSCLYPGRTICVLGYNKRYRRSQYDAGTAPSTTDITNIAHVVPNHELYVIPFKWKAVGRGGIQAAEDRAFRAPPAGKTGEEAAQAAACAIIPGGYDCPYLEIRKKMMEEADAIVEEAHLENVLYRWIDRDASDDTTGNIIQGQGFRLLNEMAKMGIPKFLSGIYNWNGESVAHPNVYTTLNTCERMLRYTWHTLNKRYSLNSKYFYLPEPTLIMNRAAHFAAKNNLDRMISASGDVRQDRESEAAFGNGKSGEVIFAGLLSVTKPVKQGYSSDFETLTANPETPTLAALLATLKNLRQSAFDNGQWAFIQDADYKDWDKDKVGQLARIQAIKDEVAAGNWLHTLELAQLKLNEARWAQADVLHAAF